MQNKVISDSFDVVVIGGGVAGVCAAIRSARTGAKTMLINDRPVLGGNSSVEIGVLIQGADELGHFRYSRETGLLDELFARNVNFPNPKLSPSVWSLVLWEACGKERNLTVMMNAFAHSPKVSDGKITSICVDQISTERTFDISAKIFIECSGDGRVAFEAGADFKTGRESIKEFGEPLAPEEADSKTMGNTVYIKARDMGRSVPFTPPTWAYKFETDDDFPGELRDCPHNCKSLFSPTGGYWWLEFGGERDIIGDAEFIRDELYRIAVGVWDHIKNKGDHGAENYVLESVGTVPGRRESRRFLGDYVMTQQDIQSLRKFPDAVAYGGWHLDLHNPAGVLGKGQRYWNGRVLQGRYTIPYRSLYSRNITNLLLAGRLISATHIAMGTTRVMGTCALMGEAVGLAAAMCVQKQISPRTLGESHIDELQQELLRLDCHIPNMAEREKNNLAATAEISASSTLFMPTFVPQEYRTLAQSRAQNITVSPGDFSGVMLYIENTSSQPQTLTLHVVKQEFIDDLRNALDIRTATGIARPGKSKVLFEFPTIDVKNCEIFGLCLDANANVSWGFTAQEAIGTQAGILIDQVFSQPGSELYYHRIRGTHCFELLRENDIYSPREMVTGVSRPEKRTNIWISQPAMPQQLELQWKEPVTVHAIELTFDNDLDATRETWAENMFAAELVRNYSIVATDSAGNDILLADVKDNIYRKKVHRLETAVSTKKLKLQICSTWGTPLAKVFDVKVL